MGSLRLMRTYECREPVCRRVVQHGELVLQAQRNYLQAHLIRRHAIVAAY